MSLLLFLILLVALPAVLSTVAATGLSARFPALSRRRRVAVAALLAGLLPVIPGLIAVWRTYRLTTLVPVVAVLMLGLIVALVVGAPAAFHATRKAPKP